MLHPVNTIHHIVVTPIIKLFYCYFITMSLPLLWIMIWISVMQEFRHGAPWKGQLTLGVVTHRVRTCCFRSYCSAPVHLFTLLIVIYLPWVVGGSVIMIINTFTNTVILQWCSLYFMGISRLFYKFWTFTSIPMALTSWPQTCGSTASRSLNLKIQLVTWLFLRTHDWFQPAIPCQ